MCGKAFKMKIRTCPNCGSTDVEIDRTMGITGAKYRCGSCGYSGDIIIEQDVEKTFRK